MKKISLIFCALLSSCDTTDISYKYPDNPDYARKSRAGTAFSKKDLVVYGKKKGEEKSTDATKNNKKSELDKSPAEH